MRARAEIPRRLRLVVLVLALGRWVGWKPSPELEERLAEWVEDAAEIEFLEDDAPELGKD